MSRNIRVILGGSEGRMGKILRDLISKSEDIEIVYGFDPERKDLKTLSDVKKLESYQDGTINVYVDFTRPDAVVTNVEQASRMGIDSMIGTSGWYSSLDEVKNTAITYNRRILYSPNFSPGVNVLFHIAYEAVRLLGNFEYDVAVREAHHTGKVDAPSGTAITLGNILLKGADKAKLAHERRDKREDFEIDVLGMRIGKVAGHHEIWYTPKESYSERLILQHDVFKPEVFGIGALRGIRWIAEAQKKRKSAGVYTFYEDVLGLTQI